MSRDALLEAVWAKKNTEDGASSDNSVTVVISRLRKALGDTARPHKYIETRRNGGYILVASVTEIPISEKPIRQLRVARSGGQSNTSAQQHLTITPSSEVVTPASRLDEILRREYPGDHPQVLSKARTLWITGLNLSRFYPPERFKPLENLVRAGGKINVLMLSPHCDAIGYGGQQDFGRDADIMAYRTSIINAHNRFRKLRSLHPEHVQLRVTDYPLTFGLDAVDIDTPRGVIYVTFYPIHSEQGDRPIVVLRPHHAYWYGFYREQLEKQWNDFGARYYLTGSRHDIVN